MRIRGLGNTSTMCQNMQSRKLDSPHRGRCGCACWTISQTPPTPDIPMPLAATLESRAPHGIRLVPRTFVLSRQLRHTQRGLLAEVTMLFVYLAVSLDRETPSMPTGGDRRCLHERVPGSHSSPTKTLLARTPNDPPILTYVIHLDRTNIGKHAKYEP